MSFREDIPNYKSYREDKYIMYSSPSDRFWSELSGMILRAANMNSSCGLKFILDKFAEIIPCQPTSNWGYDYLKNDVSDFVYKIKQKVINNRFDILMDCLTVIVECAHNILGDINLFLEEHKIGYRCEFDSFSRSVYWTKRDETYIADDIDNTKSIVKSVSQQAFEEMERAIVSLENSDTERARKDALRSCISAMEAVVKEYGNANEIGQATRNLRESGSWGLEDIVKEGNAIFNSIHRFYPDLRHGSTESSNMSMEEAEYWMGRINNYLRYMKKMADKNGN